MSQRICAVDDCSSLTVARGWCARHWQRWRKHGDPLTVLPSIGAPPIDPWLAIDSGAGPDECWPWTQSTDRDGYGVVKIAQKQWRVPRWVLTEKLGRDLTPDEVTRHTCDNRICCNPAHLLVGAVKDNARDMVDRGRSLTGDRHWSREQPGRLAGTRNAAHALTDGEVRAIRAEYVRGVTRQVDLADKYGVTQSLISQIIRRASWRHID